MRRPEVLSRLRHEALHAVESPSTVLRRRTDRARMMRIGITLVVLALLAAHAASRQVAADGSFPAETDQILQILYGGDFSRAASQAHRYSAAHPEDPLGYLLEADARWWEIYCEAAEIQWGMVDAWKRSRQPADDVYLNLSRQAVSRAAAQLNTHETATAHLYAGMGEALAARLYGLRDERLATARAGVRARQHFLRALQLDPSLADAYTGLGLYNYYVDTLSPLVKVLRVFLGIPGGNKRQGIQQLRLAMARGHLTAVEARFYLAKNLRTYDHQYAEARTILAPLAERYPSNLVFQLLLANLDVELGHRSQAATELNAVLEQSMPSAACTTRLHQLARRLSGSVP